MTYNTFLKSVFNLASKSELHTEFTSSKDCASVRLGPKNSFKVSCASLLTGQMDSDGDSSRVQGFKIVFFVIVRLLNIMFGGEGIFLFTK